jgi:release factor glutamine methyltransferase
VEHTHFQGLVLATRPGVVMTPRPASERLVETALGVLGGRRATVADVGTGSGAVAVAVAKGAPQVQVWATDTSPAAVAVARENVFRHGLAGRVVVRMGDLLDPVPGSLDLVVANLPYLPAGRREWYPDLTGEPAEAVFAAGDGLAPYRRLINASAERLTSDGMLVIQFRRRVLAAHRDELDALRDRLENDSSAVLEAA